MIIDSLGFSLSTIIRESAYEYRFFFSGLRLLISFAFPISYYIALLAPPAQCEIHEGIASILLSFSTLKVKLLRVHEAQISATFFFFFKALLVKPRKFISTLSLLTSFFLSLLLKILNEQ